MNTRESGMPDETMWSGFFSSAQTLATLGLTASCGDSTGWYARRRSF